MHWSVAIFDWDGTLVDSIDLSYKVVCRQFSGFNLKPPSREVYLDASLSNPSNFEAFYKAHGVPETSTHGELSTLWGQYFAEHAAELKPRAGAIETLRMCRAFGMRTAIVSANLRSIIDDGLERMGISHLIDHIEAEASGKVKELRRVLDIFAVEPDQAVYVDDMFEGVRAARTVGIPCVALEGGFGKPEHIRQAQPTFTARTHEDVRRILAENNEVYV